jgi:hypothetical protein
LTNSGSIPADIFKKLHYSPISLLYSPISYIWNLNKLLFQQTTIQRAKNYCRLVYAILAEADTTFGGGVTTIEYLKDKTS